MRNTGLKQAGIKIARRNISNLRYADDTTLWQKVKKNKIMPFAATCMDLEIVILSEVSQTQNNKHHMILLIYGIKKGCK